MQTSATPAYEAAEALSRGTLFPGLDLPFMNIVNDTQPVTPLTELMAIDFVTDELELYLDTHADDKEAFSMYQTFLALRKEARCRYAEKYGPVDQSDMLGENSYSWLKDPWPWEYQSKTEG
ncbi:MAG: spore coat protein CotJB [Clostridiales bacterium]|nr:MAG: spore coat protein CotJB [Clostridiales bacterium]